MRESRRWVHRPEEATLSENGRLLLLHLPRRWRKSVVWRSSVSEEPRELVEEAISEARTAGSRSLVWHTGEGKAPPEMGSLLADRGFTITEELEVQAFELRDGGEPRSPRVGETEAYAETVRSVEGLREAGKVDSEVFGKPEPSQGELEEFAREFGKLEAPGETEDLRLRFLAHTPQRRAVAAAGMQVTGGVGRLWGSGTLPPYRGLGAYRELVRERCEAARLCGATLVLTKADASTSAPILRRAGFSGVCREGRYGLRL